MQKMKAAAGNLPRSDSAMTFDSQSSDDSGPDAASLSAENSLFGDDFWDNGSLQSNGESLNSLSKTTSKSLPDLRRQASEDSIWSGNDNDSIASFTPRADSGFESDISLKPVGAISSQKNRFDKKLAKRKKKSARKETGVDGPLFHISGLPPRPCQSLSPPTSRFPQLNRQDSGYKSFDDKDLVTPPRQDFRGNFNKASNRSEIGANSLSQRGGLKPRGLFKPHTLAPHSSAIIPLEPVVPTDQDF